MRKFVGKLALAIAVGMSSVVTFALSAHATTTTNLFDASWVPNDSAQSASLELGVRVTTSSAGYVTEVKYYKYAASTTEHVAHVWDENGVLLATQTFTDESASGWQTIELDDPLAIAAGATFTVSIFSTDWHYPDDAFPNMTVGPLTITNGFYKYAGASQFPDQTVGKNYAVDFTFSDTLPTDTPSLPDTDPAANSQDGSGSVAISLANTGRNTDAATLWAIGGAAAVAVGLTAVVVVPRRRRDH